MHLETIDDHMLELTRKLDFLQNFSFFLSGGTGLALQIGHRKSFDMDFFTPKEFSPEELSMTITSHNLTMEGRIIRHGTLHCILEKVKTSFIFYNELLLFPLKVFNSIYVADWRDIIVEKLRTIAERGQKKDFYDFYFAVQMLGIDTLTELVFKKFGKKVNYFHLLKGLSYFEDADRNPEPLLLNKGVKWDEVKRFFLNNIQEFERAFSRVKDF